MAETLKEEVRALMCQLTPDEQRDRGVLLAATIKELEDLAEKKRLVQDEIKSAEARRDMLASVVKNCQEERQVLCRLEPDFEADSMTVRRLDTGSVVCVRQLTYVERQQLLNLDEEG